MKKMTSSSSKLRCASCARNNLNLMKIAQSTDRATLAFTKENFSSYR